MIGVGLSILFLVFMSLKPENGPLSIETALLFPLFSVGLVWATSKFLHRPFDNLKCPSCSLKVSKVFRASPVNSVYSCPQCGAGLNELLQ